MRYTLQIWKRECSSGYLPTRPPAIRPHDELRATEIFHMPVHIQLLVSVQLKKQFISFLQTTTISTDYTNQSLRDQPILAQLDRISAPFETKRSLLCSQKRVTILGPDNSLCT